MKLKVQIEMDPRLVSYLEDTAEEFRMTPGEVVREALRHDTSRVRPSTLEDRVRAGVVLGECDADIAAATGVVVGTIATIRRRLGLPANRRYGRAA